MHLSWTKLTRAFSYQLFAVVLRFGPTWTSRPRYSSALEGALVKSPEAANALPCCRRKSILYYTLRVAFRFFISFFFYFTSLHCLHLLFNLSFHATSLSQFAIAICFIHFSDTFSSSHSTRSNLASPPILNHAWNFGSRRRPVTGFGLDRNCPPPRLSHDSLLSPPLTILVSAHPVIHSSFFSSGDQSGEVSFRVSNSRTGRRLFCASQHSISPPSKTTLYITRTVAPGSIRIRIWAGFRSLAFVPLRTLFNSLSYPSDWRRWGFHSHLFLHSLFHSEGRIYIILLLLLSLLPTALTYWFFISFHTSLSIYLSGHAFRSPSSTSSRVLLSH